MSVEDLLSGSQGSQLEAVLRGGLETISENQEINVTLYNRVVLPLDGMVFWVKVSPAQVISVKGSLHYATVNKQDEAANISNNSVVFTSEVEINDLNEVAPGTLWIANFNGLKIAFSERGSFYAQANLYHYRGYALFADMATQVIDNPANLPSELIVSNSLPIWLFLSNYVPSVPAYGFSNPFTLYPSFLVPDDLDPTTTPYGSVHIGDPNTEALQASPIINSTQSHYQLCHDTVSVTLYGGTNKQALDFVDCINQYSVDYDTIGIMNLPVIRDAKRTQAEFSTIAMKKMVQFECSYYQSNVEAVARKLITKSVPSFERTS